MDNLLKYALDGDVVNFVAGFKAKMADVFSGEKEKMTRQVVADMAGTPVMELEDNLEESIKSDLDSLKADEMKRKGKLVTLYWKGEGKVSKADVEKAVKSNMDKIKFVGVSNEDGKTVAEIEMK